MKIRIPALLALASAALLACEQENHAGPEFVAICANPDPDAGGCTYASTCDAVALFNYAYDPFVADDLLVPIEFSNPLLDNSDPSSGRVNTNDAFIQQWRFEYLAPATGAVVMTARFDQALTVPTEGTTVGLVPVIPESLRAWAQALVGVDLVVNVRAAGRYADDRYFETGPFRVPVGIGFAAPAISCTAPAVPRACPQLGQSGTYACVTP